MILGNIVYLKPDTGKKHRLKIQTLPDDTTAFKLKIPKVTQN